MEKVVGKVRDNNMTGWLNDEHINGSVFLLTERSQRNQVLIRTDAYDINLLNIWYN